MSISLPELHQLVVKNQFKILDFDFEHYQRLETLPFFHNDPFDRMLIAQASSEKLTLITQDSKFASYDQLVPVLWN